MGWQFLNLYMRPENAGGLAGSGLGGRVWVGWQFLNLYTSPENAGGLAGSRWSAKD